MRRLVERGLDQNVCNTTIPGSADDVIIGMGILSASSKNEFLKMIFQMIAQCLQRLDVTFGDTRDELGHQRFIPYNVEEFYSNEGPNMNFIHDADFYPFEKVSSWRHYSN
jgi:hypothetical protein